MNKYFVTTALILTGILLPKLSYAQATQPTQTVLGEVSNFGEFISLIWNFGSQVLLAFAVFFIILGALFYVGSAGDQQKMEQGKQMVFGALAGVVVVIFSGALIRLLHKPAENSTNTLTDIPNVINNASTILMSLIGTFTVLMFVYAGLMTITASGDAEKINKANRALRYAIYGLLIGISAYGMVQGLIGYLL